ncbi:MAG: transporter [Anaerocolumna sp.]|nr:transporter [Anaerocolumna sp.]
MTLTSLHIAYIIITILILVALLFKKEIVVPCIAGILIIGFTYSGSVIKSIQILNNALINSSIELLNIIIVIALVVSMSKAMIDLGADEVMMNPVRKIIKNNKAAFWIIGFTMLIVSWLIWPSPAVALIGALLLPVAGEVGLPVVWAAVAMNIFGHGMGLSSDFVIQGAPSITAAAAGIDVNDVIKASIPLWITMSVVTAGVAYIMMLRDMKLNKSSQVVTKKELVMKEIKKPRLARFIAILMPLSFITDIVIMIIFKINGGDATALVAGTALILTCIITIMDKGVEQALETATDHMKEGFKFAIKIFAPVIVIAAFFFMGSEGFAQKVLGPETTGLLDDIGLWVSTQIPLSKFSIVLTETAVGVITGLDGSGFSGLPLVGSIAQTFSSFGNLNVASLAALGQIVTIWVGGGTIIPWGVIPVAAICGIEAKELARKNLIPVLSGFAATIIVALFLI